MLEEQNSEKQEEQGNFSFLLNLIKVLLTLPIFLVVRNSIEIPNWPLYLDVILLLIVVFGLVSFLVNNFKKSAYVVVLLMLILLTIGSFSGKMGFVWFYKKYSTLIENLDQSDKPVHIIKETLTPDRTGRYDYLDDKVFCINDHHQVKNEMTSFFTSELFDYDDEIKRICKGLSIFKKIKHEWIYVSDHKKYTSTADEAFNTMGGDFDDYAVLICSLLKTNGLMSRIVDVNGSLHPELYIGGGNYNREIKELIKRILFGDEAESEDIVIHLDPEGRNWISLSFSGDFPGRKILSDIDANIDLKVIKIIEPL